MINFDLESNELLRYWKKKHGYTNTQVAEMFDVSPSAVESWLRPAGSKAHRNMPRVFANVILQIDHAPYVEEKSRWAAEAKRELVAALTLIETVKRELDVRPTHPCYPVIEAQRAALVACVERYPINPEDRLR